MDDSTISFIILGAVVVLFIWDRLPVEVVAVGAALSLYFTGILDEKQIIAGFGDTTVVLIAALFVVSEGLDATGVTTWAGQQMISRAGTRRRRLLLLMMLLVAVLTAFISINGAVAALIPMVVVMAIKLKDLPSKYLMPLAFAASAGSLLALTGTPVNVIVSDARANAGEGQFGYFEFALVGIPLLVGTILIVLTIGPKLLPERESLQTPVDLSRIATSLVEGYELEGNLFYLRVRSASPMVNKPLGATPFGAGSRVTVVQVLPASEEAKAVGGRITTLHRPPAPEAPSAERQVSHNDVLVVRGDPDQVGAIAAHNVLSVLPSSDDDNVAEQALISRELGVAEVVVTPRSQYLGRSVKPGAVQDGLVILAVSREGRDLGVREVDLRAGDTLLVQGPWSRLTEDAGINGLVLVNSPDVIRRQAVPFGPKAKRAVAILAGMVILLATGAVPSVIAGLSAATAMILFRVLTPAQAYRAISWTTVILIGALFPLSTALTETGAAASVADAMVNSLGEIGPTALLAGVFILTFVFSQLISNAATSLIVVPIAVSAATSLEISPSPLLMTVTVAAAAAFMTPIATPANLMVMGPAGYRFGDYWKLGSVLSLLFFVVAVLLIPVIWQF
jgi:di/tricarboxylate transporter